GKLADQRLAERNAQFLANRLRQRTVGVAGEDEQVLLAHVWPFRSLLVEHGGNPKVAGAVGFEPTNAGIKTRCLGPLGDAPTQVLNYAITPFQNTPRRHRATANAPRPSPP